MRIKKTKEEPVIPTASMADIAFLLIVFFMLTTVFSANQGIGHVLPHQKDRKDVIDPEESIYIEIFPGGQAEIDKRPFTMDQIDKVYNYVSAKQQKHPDKPIILHTNREAAYGDMVTVFNELKKLSIDMHHDLAITIPSKAEAQRYSDLGVQ